MATEILRNVPTSELQLGDVVLCNGMRVELNREAHIRQYEQDGPEWTRLPVYAWVGDVLNAEEAISEYGIPRGFLRSHTWEDGKWSQEESYPVWNVQGNSYARWTVERERPRCTWPSGEHTADSKCRRCGK